MKRIHTANNESKLEKRVQSIINSHAANYDNGADGFLRDLFYGGCQSGIVGELIYYHDTLRFYKRYQREIDSLLQELLNDCGGTPSELFARSGWDNEDPLARDTINQNLLAWFGFEETARNLANKAGIDV